MTEQKDKVRNEKINDKKYQKDMENVEIVGLIEQ